MHLHIYSQNPQFTLLDMVKYSTQFSMDFRDSKKHTALHMLKLLGAQCLCFGKVENYESFLQNIVNLIFKNII